MKTYTLKMTSMTAVATLFFAFISCAQGPRNNKRNQKPPSVEQLMEHMDANEDGKLSKKEVKGPLKDDFDKIDANEDGFLSEEEIEKAPKPKGRRPGKN